MARAVIVLGASEMDTDEAVSSVIPSGMEYWSDTCCCTGVIDKKYKSERCFKWVFFFHPSHYFFLAYGFQSTKSSAQL